MNLTGKRILVTGGAGFIGSHVVSELLQTDVSKVIIYDNFARGKLSYLKNQLSDSRCEVYKHGGDVRDIDVLHKAVSEVDGVIHLAAMWLLHCKDFPRTAFDVNIQGTFNVLEACVSNGVGRLVYSSSASVYGDAVQVPMTENHPFNNRNFYGATKIAGEAMCRAFNDRYGLSYVGLRYMNVYGPHQDQKAAYSGVIPTMLNSLSRGEDVTINGDGSQSYDFIDVRDVAKCNVKALESNVTDNFYNVGTGVQTSIKELCELILDISKASVKINYVPYSKEDVRSLVQNRVGATEKASRDLGFSYSVDLRQGLIDLVGWRNKQNFDND